MTAFLALQFGWRLAFVIGGVIGFIVLLLRRFIPESPRWLMTHGDPEGASKVVAALEQRIGRETGKPLPPVPPGSAPNRTPGGNRSDMASFAVSAFMMRTPSSSPSFCSMCRKRS